MFLWVYFKSCTVSCETHQNLVCLFIWCVWMLGVDWGWFYLATLSTTGQTGFPYFAGNDLCKLFGVKCWKNLLNLKFGLCERIDKYEVCLQSTACPLRKFLAAYPFSGFSEPIIAKQTILNVFDNFSWLLVVECCAHQAGDAGLKLAGVKDDDDHVVVCAGNHVVYEVTLASSVGVILGRGRGADPGSQGSPTGGRMASRQPVAQGGRLVGWLAASMGPIHWISMTRWFVENMHDLR